MARPVAPGTRAEVLEHLGDTDYGSHRFTVRDGDEEPVRVLRAGEPRQGVAVVLFPLPVLAVEQLVAQLVADGVLDGLEGPDGEADQGFQVIGAKGRKVRKVRRIMVHLLWRAETRDPGSGHGKGSGPRPRGASATSGAGALSRGTDHGPSMVPPAGPWPLSPVPLTCPHRKGWIDAAVSGRSGELAERRVREPRGA